MTITMYTFEMALTLFGMSPNEIYIVLQAIGMDPSENYEKCNDLQDWIDTETDVLNELQQSRHDETRRKAFAHFLLYIIKMQSRIRNQISDTDHSMANPFTVHL